MLLLVAVRARPPARRWLVRRSAARRTAQRMFSSSRAADQRRRRGRGCADSCAARAESDARGRSTRTSRCAGSKRELAARRARARVPYWSPSTGTSTLCARSPVGRRPVDIEEAGVHRGLAVLEHVHPPGVVAAEDAHVVRHEIEDVPHAVARAARRQALEVRGAADLRVERVVVDDVVAVRAAGARAKVRRAVQVADAERGQVGHERGGIGEGEAGVELQAIGGARDLRARAPRRRCRGASSRRHRRAPAATATRHGASSPPAVAAPTSACVAKISRAGRRAGAAAPACALEVGDQVQHLAVARPVDRQHAVARRPACRQRPARSRGMSGTISRRRTASSRR